MSPFATDIGEPCQHFSLGSREILYTAPKGLNFVPESAKQLPNFGRQSYVKGVSALIRQAHTEFAHGHGCLYSFSEPYLPPDSSFAIGYR
jgi:hypothetical protein